MSEVQVKTAVSLFAQGCTFEILFALFVLVFCFGFFWGGCCFWGFFEVYFSFKLAERQYKIIGW